MKQVYWLMIVAFGLILSGCGGYSYLPPPKRTQEADFREQKSAQQNNKSIDKFESPEEEIENPKKKIFIPERYIIATPILLPGDSVRVDIVDEADLTREYVIPSDGIIRYPIIKEVTVQGKTIQEVTEELEKRLKSYLKDPVVNVSVTKWKDRRVYVYGLEENSRAVILPNNEAMTIAKLLISIGISEKASDLNQVRIVRQIPGKPREVIRIPLEDILDDYKIDYDVVLQPSDMILLQKNGKVYIQGEVMQPGSYPIKKDEKLSVWSLILQAKGPLAKADLEEVEIIREVSSGKRKSWKISVASDARTKAFFLKPNDLVSVSRNKDVDNVVTVYGEVRNPGAKQLLNKKSRLSSVIALAGGLTEYASYSIRVVRAKNGKAERYLVDFNKIVKGDIDEDMDIYPGDLIFVDTGLFG